MQEKKPTGYPSIDKPWLKYYPEGAEERANNIPLNKTVWNVIEEKLIEYKDIPAIEYFGRTISRPEFIDMVYTWARAFKALGIQEDEVVPYYGPLFPDVCAMTFAFNIIGACPYFLKLQISPDALAEETKNSRVAIVYDDMWKNVSCEFTKDRFEKIIIIKATDGMTSPKKQIVNALSKIKPNPCRVPKEYKYYSVKHMLKLANSYTGNLDAKFKRDRSAFISSSSGTTVDGIVKGTVATNESTISQLYMGVTSETQFYPGDRCLNNLPPTASTSLNLLFFMALFCGETILVDPRISEKDFYSQIIHLKPNQACSTGSAWEAFFNRVSKEMEAGKKFDFSYAKGWAVGGEGTDCEKYQKWNKVMDKAKAPSHLFSGYGSSEVFSSATTEKLNARYDYSKQIICVGIPYAGIIVGCFDEDGNELGYSHRGEIWIKTKSSMKEYYNKPELTANTKVDGWIHTGDMGEIDENGFVYIWGRMNDKFVIQNKKEVFLFDVANLIKTKHFVDDAMVMSLADKDNKILVSHIVWADDPNREEKKKHIEELNAMIRDYSEDDFAISGYYEHKTMLPYSPTTLKKDRNKMAHQLDGYMQVVNGELTTVNF